MKQNVLFLCTGNSSRSQMAEGWLRHVAGDRFEVVSAGTSPSGINPIAVQAMREIGVDISSQRSKHVRDLLMRRFEYVITVCDRAQESCPAFWGAASILHWSFEDPVAAQGTELERGMAFQRVRDGMRARIDEWIGNLPRSECSESSTGNGFPVL